MEGLMERWNNDRLRNNWPSVMEITLVAIYSLMSELIVSIIGRADIEPLSDWLNIRLNLSKIELWTLKMAAGNACRDGIDPMRRLSWR